MHESGTRAMIVSLEKTWVIFFLIEEGFNCLKEGNYKPLSHTLYTTIYGNNYKFFIVYIIK